jgi:hypothetical protein
MAKFKMDAPRPTHAAVTCRLGTAATAEGRYTDAEQYKLARLVGDSRYALCAAGEQIEAQIYSVEPIAALQDGYTMGSVKTTGQISAICDGLQASPGTGTLAVGDYVVCGTVTAKDTALTTSAPNPKVCKATEQPGSAIVGTFNAANVGINIRNSMFAWRVVSLGDAGAVGDTCLIERVNEV